VAIADKRGGGPQSAQRSARAAVYIHRASFLRPKTELSHHVARHRLADLFLDNLPVNAHTAASDALWVGLPVLTCAGDSFIGRVAAEPFERQVAFPSWLRTISMNTKHWH